MGRRLVLLPVFVTLILVGSAGGASASTRVTIRSAQVTGLGSVLVDARGRTLYTKATKSASCVVACAVTWPPVLVNGAAQAGAGPGLTAAKLGTIKRPDGYTQVTYNGFALYRYAADQKAGDVKGQAAGGVWFAVSPASGKPVKAAPADATKPGAPATNGGIGAGGEMEPYPSVAGGSGMMN
jgi:predicted lipoprotein with Yx(FWY)xxD motif